MAIELFFFILCVIFLGIVVMFIPPVWDAARWVKQKIKKGMNY